MLLRQVCMGTGKSRDNGDGGGVRRNADTDHSFMTNRKALSSFVAMRFVNGRK